MAEEYLAINILFLQERVRVIERRLERRLLRDAQNPFELSNNEFISQFRVNKEVVMDIVTVLRPYLQKQRITGLSVEVQVLVAFGFFANGSYQRPAGNQCELVVSQPCANRCIRKVVLLMNIHFLRRWISFPITAEEKTSTRNKFAQAPQPFPGAIGAIDCTHINILAPQIHEEAYVNHHGNHSLNVQAIVDSDLKILNINARYPGARNDAYIWGASAIRNVMEYSYNHGERRTYLIGDAGYPLEPWLMTPLPHYPQQSRQFHYNEQLCKARSVVERFFGVLKGTWRCLSYQRVLMYAPEVAGQIVNTCAVLHNMRLYYRLPFDEIEEIVQNEQAELDERDNVAEIQDVVLRRPPRAVAQRIQKQIMRERFPNYYCAWDNEENM
ncbi:putative nuclease HARBI1 [Temnothorax nylanderi]|uniref:putative nuclease HARBI1 n=1 Tax=Temnothorax nylanderi TaxID=102681 RepID=UPI003A8532AC